MAGITKSGGQKHKLDKFYTKPEIAKKYIQLVGIENYSTIIEPSAGSGAFSSQIENCVAFDLHPEHSGITKQNWLEYLHTREDNETVLVIGNPPFGQQNNLALSFINHASTFANRIAFILPISFKKDSIQSKINPYFHLSFEEIVPKNSFELNGETYDVKCVFQIWDKKDTKRVITDVGSRHENNVFTYVKKTEAPDACVQRIGGNTGKVHLDWEGRSDQSNYFIRFKNRENMDKITKILNTLFYPARDYVVGPRSLSKLEINSVINNHFKAVE